KPLPVRALAAAGEAPAASAPPEAKPASALSLPLLPLRNTVLFPGLFMPLSVGRPNSVAAVENVLMTEEKAFIVSAQKDGAEALRGAVSDLAAKVLELAEVQAPVSIQQLVSQSADPLRFAFLLGSMLSLEVSKEQALLEATSRRQALSLLHEYLTHEVQVLEL